MAIILVDKFPEFDNKIMPIIQKFFTLIKAETKVVSLSHFDDIDSMAVDLFNMKNFLIGTKKGIIFSPLQEIKYRKAFINLSKLLKIPLILEVPEHLYLDRYNLLVYDNALFIGINEKVSTTIGTFLYNHLVVKKKMFDRIVGIRCPGYDLIDVMNVLKINNNYVVFLNKNLIMKELLLFGKKGITFVSLRKLKLRTVEEIKTEETTLKHTRFFAFNKKVLIFDDAYRLKDFFSKQGFLIFDFPIALRNELTPLDLFVEL